MEWSQVLMSEGTEQSSIINAGTRTQIHGPLLDMGCD